MGCEGSGAYQRGKLTVNILKNKLFFVGVCVIGLVFFWFSSSLKADPMDTQDHPIAVSSTPDNEKEAPGEDEEALNEDKATANDMDRKTIRDTKNDGVNNNDVNFSYFLTSGYAANDISGIPSVGKVSGTPELDGSLSTAKTLYVVVPSSKIKLEPGEKLIVFGDGGPIREKNSGFNKRFIKNLAVLKVREGEGRRYLADVLTSYDNIPLGSPVKLYSGEKEIWDKAQVSKEFPTKTIKCFVAGGERGRDNWNQTDYVILTAGTKQGVVEGLIFQLWEVQWDKNVKLDGIARGFAKVFYAGSSYSIARIQEGSDSIFKGFEAVYNP
jgi:hypothetical protein